MFNKPHAIFGLLALFFFSVSTPAAAQKAPAFSLDSDNGKISLNQYKNKLVYLDFWASWCKPCRTSFKFMNEIQQRYGSKGLQIIAINLDEDKASAARFLKSHPATFKIAYDPDGNTPGAYNLKVMPTSYLIDKGGNIILTHKGFKETQAPELEKMIAQALNKK